MCHEESYRIIWGTSQIFPRLNRKSFWFVIWRSVPELLFSAPRRKDTHDQLHRTLFLADTSPYWISVIDWMLKLIRLIRFIFGDSYEVTTVNRLNCSGSLQTLKFCFLIHHQVQNLFIIGLSNKSTTNNFIELLKTFLKTT